MLTAFVVTGVGGGGARTRHYWREDILEMGEQLSQLQDGIDRHDPDAAQAMQHFKEAQVSRVEARFEVRQGRKADWMTHAD